MRFETSIQKPVEAAGVGLHSGVPVSVRILPAPPGTGIVFLRTDLDRFPVQASWRHVARVSYATSLMRQGVLISTTEHLLSVLYSMGVDNAFIEIDNLEVPILDGSGLPFVELLAQAGLRAYRRRRRYLRIRRPVSVEERDKRISVLPDDRFALTCDVFFNHPLVGRQTLEMEVSPGKYASQIAPARTFGFLSEVDQRHLLIALQCMRMVCNSTYLLDGSTDYGVKADELVALLRDLLEEPGTKVVVFSQWIRMHELVQRRLQRRGWDHVMFSGEVPGRQRRHLVQRFREDPRCRLFLSTDAGGVGLNLQHANCVVILDQPWNPAVLEQRIGRVHRLGQQQPVRVLHLIAQGTIEEGMLSLLGFKSAMFAGVLDGGSDEVFLGGSRLKRFMESVERATSAISRPMTTQEDEAAESRRVRHPRTAAVSTDETQAEAARRSLQRATPRSGTAEARERASRVAPTGLVRTGEAPIAASSAPAIDGDAWADLFSTGAALVHKLAALLGGREGVSPATESGGAPLGPTAVAHDPQTGQPYLKIPLPPPETLQQVARLLSALVEGSRPR